MLGEVAEYGLLSSLKQYISSVWNQLDCLSLLLFFIGTPLYNLELIEQLFKIDPSGLKVGSLLLT